MISAILALFGLLLAAPLRAADDPLIEGFKLVEAASVADAMEQLYGKKAYMSHDMRPLSPTKFAGRAVTVLLKKDEHNEGPKASKGMLDAIESVEGLAIDF
jgi:regulator of RNase E activity RraA